VRSIFALWTENLKVIHDLGDLAGDGKTLLKWILDDSGDPMVGTHGQHMHFLFTKSGWFLNEMNDYSVLKKDSLVSYFMT
jgi:hypothetical protein